MTTLMADGFALDPNDPASAAVKRATFDGPIVRDNPVANIVPASADDADLIATLLARGVSNELRLFLHSTLMLNLCRRELGKPSIAAEPLEARAALAHGIAHDQAPYDSES